MKKINLVNQNPLLNGVKYLKYQKEQSINVYIEIGL